MKTPQTTSITLATFLFIGASFMAPAMAMMGGVPTDRSHFPWIVELRNGSTHECAGVLISPDRVLTAGHCISPDILTKKIYSGGLSGKLSELPFVSEIKAAEAHPDFQKDGRIDTDFGLIQLKMPLQDSTTQAIALPSQSKLRELYANPQTRFMFAGWGKFEGGEYSDNLRQMSYHYEIPWLQWVSSIASRNNIYSHFLSLFSPDAKYQIFTGLNPGSGACSKDSGSPVVAYDSNETAYLIGVVSAGTKDDCKGGFNAISDLAAILE